jgi:hypothetical protein
MQCLISLGEIGKDDKTESHNYNMKRQTAIYAVGVACLGAAITVPAQSVFVGNYGSASGLGAAAGWGVDTSPPLVILGEYSAAGPLATSSASTTLPTGTLQDVDFYAGSYSFTLYVLSPAGSASLLNEQTFQVVASESFSGSPAPGIQTLAVEPNISVSAGDLLAFSGIGIYYPQQANDALNSDATYGDSGSWTATPPGGVGTQFTVGLNGDSSANYEYIPDYGENQGRTYAIGVDVSTVPEPKTMALLLLPLASVAACKLRKKVSGA